MIILDDREQDFIKNCEYPITVRHLELGDIILCYNEEERIIIERKTIQDLAASIKDSRYHEQKMRLLDLYKTKKIVYIIEGNLGYSGKVSGIPVETLHSALIGLTLRDNIVLYQTRNISETIKLVQMIYKKLDKINVNEDSNYISTLKLKKKENRNTEDAMLYILCQIPQVGLTIARAIREKYNSIMNLVIEFQKCNNPEMLSELKVNNKKINKNISKNIFNYFNGSQK